MGDKLGPKDLELYRAVDEVLHYVWDPIGVSGHPQARDEYYGYLPKVFGLVRDGAHPEEVAAHLGSITTDRMCLSVKPGHDLKVAHLLAAWREAIDAKFAQQ